MSTIRNFYSCWLGLQQSQLKKLKRRAGKARKDSSEKVAQEAVTTQEVTPEQVKLQNATLCLGSRSSFHQYLEEARDGLYDNVTELRISINADGVYNWSAADDLFRRLGSLPQLQEVVFQMVDGHSVTGTRPGAPIVLLLPSSAFEAFFSAAAHHESPLRTVVFRNAVFTHEEGERVPWNMLGDLPCLETLELSRCYEQHLNQEQRDPLSWTFLLEALAQSSTLKKIRAPSCTGDSLQDAQALTSLFENCLTLEEMLIEGPKIDEASFVRMAPKLATHPNLRSFQWGKISFGSEESQTALIHLLCNNATLQTLRFHPDFPGKQTSDADNPIFEILGTTVAQGLKNNTSLKRVSIGNGVHVPRGKVPRSVPQAFLQLLQEHNHTLEELFLPRNVFPFNTDLQRSLDQCLQMNKARASIADFHSLEQWIELLARVNPKSFNAHGVSCAYELLHRSPLLDFQ